MNINVGYLSTHPDYRSSDINSQTTTTPVLPARKSKSNDRELVGVPVSAPGRDSFGLPTPVDLFKVLREAFRPIAC